MNISIYSLTDEFNSQIHFKNKIIVSWTIAFDRCPDADSPGCLQSLALFACGKKKLSSSTSEQNLAEGGDKIYMQHCQLPYLPHLTGEKIAVFHSCMLI